MAIHYVNSREFIGEFKKPKYIVVGEEQGCAFRRVFRTHSLAERFKRRMLEKPAVRNVYVVALP